jgi:hypothetical protein
VTLRVAIISCLLLLAGCSDEGAGGDSDAETPNWPAPRNAMELTRQAGLEPQRAEGLDYHVHAHLDIFVDGEPITVPAGIGIDAGNPAVVSNSQGVGLTRECDTPCISPLHTHETDGILHTETTTPRPNTLGEFFVEWNVPLTADRVGEYSDPKFYVDGKAYDGDPREIELSDLAEIVIVIGSPPDSIPSDFP